MSRTSAFSHVPAELQAIFEELRKLEPIFHNAEFGLTAEEYAQRMSLDYWEVGASGRRYSREFVLAQAGQIAKVNATSAGWDSSEFGLRQLGSDTYLLTYTLNQNGRLTRRSTIWSKSGENWQIFYHQGTVVSSNEDDTLPA